MVLSWNTEPSLDVSYSSLALDEERRKEHAHKITSSSRFRSDPSNGNLCAAFPNIEDEGVREALPPHYQVDTNTRTVFHDRFYEPKHVGVGDFAQDARRRASSLTAQPHVPLNELAGTDTRVRKLVPAYEPGIGPGHYDPDPLGEKATASLAVQPGEVHHAITYARDPTRESACFVSPERGRTGRDIADAQSQPPVCSRMTQPDYASWTSKGCWVPRSDRNIQAERWGPSVRELRPAAKDRPQGDYSPAVTANGQPNSCQAYSNDRLAPAYRVAFASGLPRLVALPAGNLDTRVHARTHAELLMTGAGVGPGSYNPEPARFRSPNAAYDTAAPYYSLASGMPGPMQGGSGGGPPSPSGGGYDSQRGSPQHHHGLRLALPGAPQRQQSASEPCSPSAAHAAVVMAERHEAARSRAASWQAQQQQQPSPSGLSRLGAGAVAGGWGDVAAAGPGRSYSSALHQAAAVLACAAAAADCAASSAGAGLGSEYGGSWMEEGPCGRARSAPIVPRGRTTPLSYGHKQFSKLAFNVRHHPCASLTRSHLKAAAELRLERHQVRQAAAGGGGGRS